MHIIFVCAEYPFQDRPTGGFGRYVRSMATTLSGRGHQVSVICQTDQRIRAQENKIQIYGLPKYFFDPIPKRLAAFLNYPFVFSIQVAKELNRINKFDPIDIIEGGDFGAELFFFLLTRKSTYPKLVIKLHTPSFVIRKFNKEPKNLFYRVMEFAEKYSVIRADGLNSPTRTLAEIVKKQLALNITHIIPYPVSLKDTTSKKRNSYTILYVGKLQPKKGVITLTNAIPHVLSKYPRTKFIFIGPDTIWNNRSVQSELIDRLEKYKVASSVKFLPTISGTELNSYYKTATLIVIPSLWENFPNVLLEAGVQQLPVIATRGSGISEILESQEFGGLFKPGDDHDLVKVIIFALAHSKVRRKRAQLLRARLINKYSQTRIADQTINFYQQILKL